jgi:replicative DNA helicase
MEKALKSKSKRPNDTNILPLSGIGRIPPQAIELEEAVLGALLIDRDALSKVIDILSSESFYVDGHKKNI